MQRRHHIHPAWYAIVDYVAAAAAWALFFFLRKHLLHEPPTINTKFWLGVLLIPAGWLILFGLVGSYRNIYKKSRLTEFTITFVICTIGCFGLFPLPAR